MTGKYEFIDREKYAYPIVHMCAWLNVSKSGDYEWRNRPESATSRRREDQRAIIRHSFDESDGTYGYRRVHAELDHWDHPCSPELVRALMHELDLVPCQPRPWRHCLTDAAPATVPDLVDRDFTTTAPGEKMVGDVTYIPTWEGWLYLATVIDCYTSAAFAETLTSYQIRQSAGRTGICFDNSMAESFFATLKNERAHRTAYPTRKQARRDITRYIEFRYNAKRLHSGLRYRTPREADQFGQGRSRICG